MTWEGALEGRNVKATLEGGNQGCQRRGLLPGPYGPFQVGAWLPGDKAWLQPISGAVKHPRGWAQEPAVGLARVFGNGGGDAVRADLQDRLRDVCQHKGEPAGVHDAQLLILLCRNLMRVVFQVSGMYGGERGDMRLKLRPDFLPERHVQGEVQWGQLHQNRELVGRDISLHHPYISRNLLVLAYRNGKEGVKEEKKAVPVGRKEGDLVDPLGVKPRESANELVWRPLGLGSGADSEVDIGTRRANGSLGRLIIYRTRIQLLQQHAKKRRQGTYLVEEMG